MNNYQRNLNRLKGFTDGAGARAMKQDLQHDQDYGRGWFHSDFVTGFRETGWWDNHRKIHRHHLNEMDGIPKDVNLLDVLEYIADCVMAGMARSGTVYELKVPDALLQAAFLNTMYLLKNQVVVKNES